MYLVSFCPECEEAMDVMNASSISFEGYHGRQEMYILDGEYILLPFCGRCGEALVGEVKEGEI